MDFQRLSQTQWQTQGLVMTPQLRQSLRVLQAPAAELSQEIAAEIAANPLLEEVEPREDASSGNDTGDSGAENDTDALYDDDEFDRFGNRDEIKISDDDFGVLRKMEQDWQDNFYDEHRSQNYTAEDAERRDYFFESAVSKETLQENLQRQARLADAPEGVLAALQVLFGNLDDRGFMTADIAMLALETHLPRADFDKAWALLKTFEPVGIGAGDLRECFLIQLLQSGRRHTLAALIVDECFPLLMKRKIPKIARELDTSNEEVREAIGVIAQLDRAPAQTFSEDEAQIITPDLEILRDENGTGWRVILNGETIPRLRINHAYKNLLAGNLSDKDRAYILEKIRDGRFLIGAIEQRQNALERIAHLLLKYQADFFENGVSHLKPLTMAQLTSDLDVHETTVGRAIANKHIRTPYGVFALRYFFTSGFTTDTGEIMANTSIREMLGDIIANEDSAAPLSDNALVGEFAKRGIKIARRTINKFRDTLGIPEARLRKRH